MFLVFQFTGLLRSVGMGAACIDKQFLVHLAAQPVFRQHTLYSSFHNLLRAALQKVLGGFFTQTTGVATEILVHLVVGFVAGKYHLFSIDNDDEITGIDVGGIRRLVLTAQNRCDSGAHTSYGLISTVHNIPVALYGSRVRMFGSEM